MSKIIVCCLCLVACAAPTSPPNISGLIDIGGPVVLIKNSTGGTCSAVVIDDNTLLTAKHCFGTGDVNVWTAPESALNPTPAAVADVYVATAAYDVVMVPLLWPLPSGTRHAQLSYKTFARGDTATIIGWGCMHTTAVEARPITYVRSNGPVMIFAGTACTGDSGGGIFDNDGAFVATTSFLDVDASGRVAYVGAVSFEAVVADIKQDATK